jgi:hypothetical protein
VNPFNLFMGKKGHYWDTIGTPGKIFGTLYFEK